MEWLWVLVYVGLTSGVVPMKNFPTEKFCVSILKYAPKAEEGFYACWNTETGQLITLEDV